MGNGGVSSTARGSGYRRGEWDLGGAVVIGELNRSPSDFYGGWVTSNIQVGPAENESDWC